MAAGDFTTTDDVKAWLGQKPEASGDDALLTRLITAASAFIVTYLDRPIFSSAFTETRDGPGGVRIQTVQYPILAVTSVAIDGQAIAAATGATDPGYVFGLTSITLRGYRFTRGRSNVALSYSAGYAVVPADIAQACIELVALRYSERSRIGFVSKSLAGETVTFSVKDMTDSIRTALSGYRSVIPT